MLHTKFSSTERSVVLRRQMDGPVEGCGEGHFSGARTLTYMTAAVEAGFIMSWTCVVIESRTLRANT